MGLSFTLSGRDVAPHRQSVYPMARMCKRFHIWHFLLCAYGNEISLDPSDGSFYSLWHNSEVSSTFDAYIEDRRSNLVNTLQNHCCNVLARCDEWPASWYVHYIIYVYICSQKIFVIGNYSDCATKTLAARNVILHLHQFDCADHLTGRFFSISSYAL